MHWFCSNFALAASGSRSGSASQAEAEAEAYYACIIIKCVRARPRVLSAPIYALLLACSLILGTLFFRSKALIAFVALAFALALKATIRNTIAQHINSNTIAQNPYAPSDVVRYALAECLRNETC